MDLPLITGTFSYDNFQRKFVSQQHSAESACVACVPVKTGPVFVTHDNLKDRSTNYCRAIDLSKQTRYCYTLQLEGYA